MHFDQGHIEAIARRLEEMRATLVARARDAAWPMDPLDRREIVGYLDMGVAPEPPRTVPDLMKSFLKSCYTHSVLRNFLTSLLGEIPTPPAMGKLLCTVFSEPAFLDDNNWYPDALRAVATRIQARERCDLASPVPRNRMTRVILDGTVEMSKRLERGIDSFYQAVESVSAASPEVMWKYVRDFSKPIGFVGPALLCDFLKEIGFLQFVKVDHLFPEGIPTAS